MSGERRTATGKGGRQETPGRGSEPDANPAADGPRRARFRDPVNGGTLRVDREPDTARVLIVHEQHGGYTRGELDALARRAQAPSLGAFLNEPFRWLAPFAVAPSRRRSGSLPLPSLDLLAAWRDALWSSAGRTTRRWLVRDRAVALDVIRNERIGLDRARGRLIFPMFDGGELVAAKWREPRVGAQMRSWPGEGRAWPLYPIPDRRAGWLLLVAGELDALAARSVGLPASSVTLGAGYWRDAWMDSLCGLRVVVAFDNNEGELACERVAALRAAGLSASRLDLRTLGLDSEKGDMTDYLRLGGEPSRVRPPRRAVRRRAAA